MSITFRLQGIQSFWSGYRCMQRSTICFFVCILLFSILDKYYIVLCCKFELFLFFCFYWYVLVCFKFPYIICECCIWCVIKKLLLFLYMFFWISFESYRCFAYYVILQAVTIYWAFVQCSRVRERWRFFLRYNGNFVFGGVIFLVYFYLVQIALF